jgi:tetratricopeptide (TPR) repeat protein
MAQKPGSFSRFWNELKRRKTDRVVVVYAAAAFTILQIEPILETAFSLPGWTSTLLIIIIVTGFPVAAIFSWFFDITPGGIKVTKPLKTSERQRIESELKRWRWITMVSIIVIILLIFFNIIRSQLESEEIKKSEKSIAVLTFESLSPDSLLPFPGEVVASIIRSKLNQSQEFSVTSPLATSGHSWKKMSVTETARRLGVFFLVHGEIARINNGTLINVNLVSKKNKLIWAHDYILHQNDDIEELYEIPLEIMRKLKIALAPEVKRKLNLRPTKSSAAYLSYVKGETVQDLATEASNYLTKGDSTFNDLTSEKSFEKAISLYDKAIEEDSTFALAYAKRALTRAWGYNAGHFLAKEHMEKCREDIEHALRIDDNLMEAKVAYGFYYYYFAENHDKALEYFTEVSEDDPKYWQCKFYSGLVLRARGQWKESQKLMREVVKSNPLNALFMTNIGMSYQYLRLYDSAIFCHDRAIRIMPQWSSPYQNKIETLIARDGNTIAAEAVVDSAEKRIRNSYLNKNRILFDLYNGKFEDALLKATVAENVFFSQGERYMIFAEIYRNMGNQDLSKNFYKSAFEFFSKKLAENPERAEALSYLGIAAAGLNDRNRAVESGQRAIELSMNNVMEKNDRILDLAKIYVMIGEYDKCLDLLKELLRTPSTMSYKILRLDPLWKPVRNMPEFKELISGYSKN